MLCCVVTASKWRTIMSESLADYLGQVPIFSNLTLPELQTIEKYMFFNKVEVGEFVFKTLRKLLNKLSLLQHQLLRFQHLRSVKSQIHSRCILLIFLLFRSISLRFLRSQFHLGKQKITYPSVFSLWQLSSMRKVCSK